MCTYCQRGFKGEVRRSFLALRPSSEQRDFVADASSNDARRGVVSCGICVQDGD